MFKRFIAWLKDSAPFSTRQEPEGPEHFAWVLSMEDREVRGKYVKVARQDPDKDTVFNPGGVTSRQNWLDEHRDVIESERHRANRDWIVSNAPDVCLFL